MTPRDLLAGALPLAVACLLVARAHAAGPAWQPVDALRAAAERVARQQFEAPGETLQVTAAVDDQLRLPACGSAPEARTQWQNAGAINVALSCAAPSAWTVYVLVQVSRRAEVLVLLRPLLAGETVAADAVARRPRDVAELPYGFVSRLDAAVGRMARRALPAGAVLAPGDLAPARIVRRGQPVVLVSRAGAIEVRAQGTAQGDGGAGEYVQVQNLGSRKLVRGRIRNGQEVEVGS